MPTQSRFANKSLHVLVAILILLTSVPMSTSVAAADTATSAAAGDVENIDAPVQKPVQKKRLEPGVRLYAVCNPAVVEPGAQVICAVTVFNEEDEDVSDLKLSTRLPKGLSPVGSKSRRWNTVVEELAVGESVVLELSLEVSGDASGPLSFEVEARGKGGLRAETTAIVGVADTEAPQINALGGSFDGKDGRIRVHFPPGALKKEAKVKARVRKQGIDPSGRAKGKDDDVFSRTGRLLSFSLEAEDVTTGESIDQFEAPVTLEIDLRGLVPQEGLLPGQHLYLIHIVDPETGEAEDVPFEYDEETGVMTAKLEHFSDYDTGTMGEGWQPMLTLPVADKFSGSMSYDYPIKTPAGRNGLQPNLTISYNSRRLDGLLGGQGKLDSAPLPLGWSVGSMPEIVRSTDREGVAFVMKDHFTLSLNGTSHKLVQDQEEQTCGRYWVENAPSIYVERRNNSAACGNGSPDNTLSDYWIVRTPDGTEYRLGYKGNAEVYVYDTLKRTICYGYCWGNGGYKDGGKTKWGAYRWRVDQVTGSLGDLMAFTYREKEIHPDKWIRTYRSAPESIQYNYDGSTYHSQVQFVFDSEDPDTSDYMRVVRIEVIDGGETIRQYAISSNKKKWKKCDETYRQWEVTSIQEIGWGGTQVLTETFDHATLYNAPDSCYPYWRVDEVGTRYGGKVRIGYVSDDRYADDYPFHGYSYRVSEMRTYDGVHDPQYGKVTYEYGTACYDQTDTDGRPCQMSPDAEEVGPLVGHDWVKETVEDYDGTVLGYNVHDYYICPDDDPDNCADWKVGRELLAQSYATPDQLTLLSESRTDWGNAPFGSDVDLVQVLQTISTDYSGGASIATKVEYEYDTFGNTTVEKHYGDVSQSGDERTVHRDYFNLDSPPVFNGGFEEGNAGWSFWQLPSPPAGVTEEASLVGRASMKLDGSSYDHGAAYQDVGGLVPGQTYEARLWVRATAGAAASFKLYLTDGEGGNWHGSDLFVPSTSWEQVRVSYTANSTGKMRFDLHYLTGAGAIYVDQVSIGSSWLIGLPYRERLYEGITAVPGGDPEMQSYVYYDGYTDYANPEGQGTRIYAGLVTAQGTGVLGDPNYFAITSMTYDQWGNVETITDPNGHVSTIEYDSTYHMYPTLSCSPEVDEVGHLCTTTQYYGVNGIPVDHGLPGRVKKVWDANGPDTATEYRYDAFGRLVKVARPLDSTTQPTVEYVYHDSPGSGQPAGMWVEVRQREVSGLGGTLDSVVYYDGLGRQVQTGSEAEGGEWTVASTEYDALGRAVKGYLPRFASSSAYAAPEGLYTLTSYDALGRVVWVAGPDGSTVTTSHAGWTTVVVDANGHRHESVVDAFGRLVQVYEYESEPTAYEAEGSQLYHRIGAASGDVWHSPSAGQSPDYLTYGPYAPLEAVGPGQVVRFRLAVGVVNGNSDAVVRIDVHDYNAAQVLAQRDIRRDEFRGGLTNFSEFPLTFDTTGRDGHHLEYRVYWYGTAKVAHDRTMVVWSGDADETAYTYDALDNLTQVTDAADGPSGGNVTTMAYDSLGRKEAMDDPDMGHWEYDYDLAGNLTEQTDANGHVLTFVYDELNRLVSKSAGGQELAGYEYDCGDGNCPTGSYGLGRRTGMSDPSGWTAWTYDKRGRVTDEIKSIDGAGTPFVTQYTYDAMDRVATMKYPDGEVVTHNYNAQGALESMSGYDPYVQNVDYNPLGQVTNLQLGNNVATRYIYDPLNFRLKDLQVDGLLDLNYDYDTMGNVTQIVDGHAPTFEDDFNSKNTANWTWSSYQTVYNDGGDNVIKSSGTGSNYDANFYRKNGYTLQEGDSVRVEFKLDRADTLAHFALESNDGGVYRRWGINEGWSGYLRAQYNDGSGYQQVDWGSGGSFPLQVGKWYVLRLEVGEGGMFYIDLWQKDDPTNSRHYERVMTSGLNWRFHHWIYRGNAYIDSYEEIDASQQFSYDALDRLTHAQATGGTAPYDRDYAYDKIGNITHKDGMGDYTYLGNGYTHSQPHAVTHIGGQRKYWYDANGNMTQRIESGKTYVQGFNAENRLQTVTEGGQTTTFTYDGDGVRVKKVDPSGTTYYVGGYYEVKSPLPARLIQEAEDGARSGAFAIGSDSEASGGQYVYVPETFGDRFGGPDEAHKVTFTFQVTEPGTYRIKGWVHAVAEGASDSFWVKVDGTPTGGYQWFALNNTHYWADFVNDWGVADPVEIELGAGSHTVAFYLREDGTRLDKVELEHVDLPVTKYYYAAGQRVAMRQGGTVYYLHGDHLGSTSLTTDAGGGFVARVLYYPYGETRYEEGTLTTDYQYTGQRHEAGFGLYDYGARYYDPYLARFVSADTIVPNPGNPQDLNRYAYVSNNPVKYTDPSGHRYMNDPVADSNRSANWRYGYGKVTPQEVREVKIAREAAKAAWRNHQVAEARRDLRRADTELGMATMGEALEALFDPYTGPLRASPAWEEAQGQEFKVRMKDAGQGLYGESGVNLWEVALAPLDNPLNEAVDNPGHPLYETVESYEWMSEALIGNSTHIPYTVFLQQLNLRTDVTEYAWNYEPNYLEALMLAHPDKLDLAKQRYRDEYSGEFLDFVLDKLINPVSLD